MLTPDRKIKKIYADGPYVVIEDQNKKTYVEIKEAIFRARAVIGYPDAIDMIEALLKAANEAKKNRDGVGFSSKSFDELMLMAKIEDPH